MKKIILSMVVVFFLTIITLNSAPLRFVPQILKQPDGEVIKCFASGDEYYNWLHDKDGYTIVQDEKGYYVYAGKVSGRLVPTSKVFGRSSPSELGVEKWIKPDKEILLEEINSIKKSRAALYKSSGTAAAYASSTGTLNNLVIFIRFADESEFTQSFSLFNSMFNNSAPNANSLTNYYREVSYGQLQIVSDFYPPLNNGSLSSYKDQFTRNYYKLYTASNPIGYKTSLERSEREKNLLANAVNSIKNSILNVNRYDFNNDGYIDNVCFIVKGSPEGWSNLLWPHMSWLGSNNISIGEKRISIYNFQLENSLLSTGVGVLAHEMFHSLGAPDLYHYSYDQIEPVSDWDLMEINSNPPQHMSAYMKYRYGHWIASIPEIFNSGKYYLNPLTSSKNNCYKISSPNSAQEFFVVEYRKRKGVFEGSLRGDGLLVYRINKNYDGWGNSSGPPDEVYLYRPGGTTVANGEPDKVNLSKDFNRDSISYYSNTSSFLSDGLPGGLSLYEIGSVQDSIGFRMRKELPNKLALTSPIGGDNFKINSSTYITWINKDISDIKIEVSTNGATWELINILNAQSNISDGKYFWNVPNILTSTAKIRISDANNTGIFSVSKNYFTISPTGQLFENEPNDNSSQASPIALGNLFEGEISSDSDVDYYTFNAVQGDTVDIFANAKNSSFRGRIRLMDDYGLDEYGDGIYHGQITQQRFSYIIPRTGKYYIRYAYRENWGFFPNSPLTNTNKNNINPVLGIDNSSSVNTGRYQISLQKFKAAKPDIENGQAWNVTLNSAILSFRVQTDGLPTVVTFEYGTTNYYGNTIEAESPNPFGILGQSWNFQARINQLLPNTTYHFRITAVNGIGTSISPDVTFATPPESQKWERQLLGNEQYLIKYIPIDKNISYVIGEFEIYKTIDGGMNWAKLKIPGTSNFFKGGNFINGNTGWIVGSAIFKTTNGGETWIQQNNPEGKILNSVCFVDAYNGTAVGQQGIIIHTSNGGNSWSVQDPGSMSDKWDGLFSVAFCDVNNGITVGTAGTILKTSNAGLTWTKQQSGTLSGLNGVYIINPLVATALGDGPCGGAGNILHTTDGGMTWVNQNNPTGNYLYGVDYLDANNGLGVGINGAIARTTDGGNTWIEEESGVRIPLRDVKFIDPSNAVIVGDWGLILKTKDLASKYISLKYPTGSEIWEVGSVQNIIWQKNNVDKINILYSSSSTANAVWDTVAAGIPASLNIINWLVPKKPTTSCRIKICDANDNTVTCQNTNPFTIKGIIESAPNKPILASPSYSQINLPSDVLFKWNKVMDSDKYYFQLSKDQLFTTIIKYDSTTTDTSRTVYGLLDGQKYYWRVSARNIIGKSPWSDVWNITTLIPSPTNLTLRRLSLIEIQLNWEENSNNKTGYIIERKLSTQATYSILDTVKNIALRYYIDTKAVQGATYYYRLKTISDFAQSDYSNEASIFLVDVDGNNLPREYSLTQNYPNPFNPSTNIKYELPTTSFVKLQVYDALGREVAELVNEEKPAGRYQVQFNAAKLSSGIYFYRISANDFTSIKKLILIK